VADAIALLVEEDDAYEVPTRPVGLLDHAPIVYRIAQRAARQMRSHRLRVQERELRQDVLSHRRYDHLNWVRLYAMRHVIEERGEAVPEL
jgi:hypothetical protein